MAVEEQAMTNDRLANLETQLGHYVADRGKGSGTRQAAAITGITEESARASVPFGLTSGTSLVCGHRVVSVLILVLSNRLRQQTRWLNDGPVAQQSANARLQWPKQRQAQNHELSRRP